MKRKQKTSAGGKALVVATAHTPEGIRSAMRLKSGALGFIEIRGDCLAEHAKKLSAQISAISLPVLLTVRHPAEGGVGNLSTTERRKLYMQLMSGIAAMDIELRSVLAMRDILKEAEKSKILRIISFHNFRTTPSLKVLQDVAQRATDAGADIVKIATQLRTARDMATLLELQWDAKYPLATMGMGPLGKVSRLALAAAGSRLNYGYLSTPQVEGQWPAKELAEMLGKVVPQ